ncbi:phosphate starvation-inducible protein [Bacillus phage BigBertha]|nr:phosphate starvation-inducible protein [Bacillus phage BigBertha]YP_009055814.1 PhoH [Bacillus phage Riley]YP_009289930.1 PhoH-like protein [Bacillus phage Phrodo]AMW61537.1 PhoH-like protein [Bacillus phage Juglone]ASZ75783.1 PhoH-like protein [Bacillus phage Taffo16]QDH49740.1 phosphate starvation-inducible protein [Bacillus phage Beyonphe]QPY77286.1 PhoH family-like protein [Bacillus phage Anthos]UGO50354.1 PhoH family-like protein [Bacillus phage vB_BanH_RonSwanson]ULF48671.1 PhoH-li
MAKQERLTLSKLSEKDFPYIKKLDREQEDMVEKLYKHKRIITNAKAGTGKTTVLTQAMNALKKKEYINKIYYVVFPVQERSVGYLPGGIADKIGEYAVPFYQALTEAGVNPQYLNLELMTSSFNDFEFKVVPHTFLRGRTIENAGIIVDEIQNGTLEEIKKTLTRCTDSCYIAMIGHTGQIDIKQKDSGFSALIHHFKQGRLSGEFEGVEFAELTKNYRGEFSTFADKLGTYKNEV